MRITVMGTGGVGGCFGARLALAGADVRFVARGAHLQALRERGLRVLSPLGDVHLERPQVADDPAAFGDTDCVLFGVKLWDTEAAARALRPVVGPQTMVISLQNGVVKDEWLRAELGAAAVVGGACWIAATIAEPGVIRHANRLQKIVFGEYGTADGASPRTRTLLELCLRAGFDAAIAPDIGRVLWEKFVLLVGLSGTTSAARLPIGAIRGHPRSRAFLRDTMAEVVAVARAAGVALDPGYADDRLAFADTLAADMSSSMHHDLERGARLELPWLAGDVVRRGTALGVPTPRNRAIADLLAPHENGRTAG